MLDLIDKRVLNELSKDARQTNSQIGKKLGLSQQVISYRIKKLIETNIIEQFHTVIRFGHLGFTNYTLLIKLNELDSATKEELIKQINEEKNVILVSKCGGKWQLIVELQARNNYNFEKILTHLIEKYDSKILQFHVFLTTKGSFFGRQYIESNETYVPTSFFGDEEVMDISKDDLIILSLLAKNCRITTLDIERKTGMHYKTVGQHIQKLKDKGIIRKFSIRTNMDFFGILSHKIFLELKKITQTKEQELLKFLTTKKDVVGTNQQIGKYNFSISIETKSQEDTWKLYEEIQSHLKNNIQSIELIPIFKKYNYNYFPESLSDD